LRQQLKAKKTKQATEQDEKGRTEYMILDR